MAIIESARKLTTPGNSGVVDTSTHTTDSDASASCATLTTNEGIEGIPVPGRTYMIRDLDSGRVITLEGGLLTLKLVGGTSGGWHWHCVERDGGWLGFQEAVSGNYLGRNGKGGFHAKFQHFLSWESFCLRPLEEGGYHLLTAINQSTFRRMGTVGDGGKLIEVTTAVEGTRWEFVKV
ncbi:hypothetical protein GGR58DRAFT_504857 [Xylaria digitata]|nr:hypothetical protein GGR58DRAFT_504857 [Xylaria digitata]